MPQSTDLDLLPMDYLPGVQRDGTRLDANAAVDALWCRWRLGRARKMLGITELVNSLAGVPRRIHMFYSGPNVYIHAGTSASLEQIVLDQSGNVISKANRTPPTFAGGPDVGWTLDSIFDTLSGQVQLVAHATTDLNFLANSLDTTPFLGPITSTSPLQPFFLSTVPSGTYQQPMISGGIVCVQPYVFDFGSGGQVGWSAPNKPLYLGITGGTTGAGAARISSQKIVAAAPLRGGGAQSPAALFWSLSELLSATFNGNADTVWSFNTISPSSSILSSDCVIEYDGLYFWAGVDRFMVYNGTVVEVPNSYNQDYFFDNLNWTYAAKSFAFKVPRFGEIWWCAPLFGATEPNYAVIYNVRENCWYDTMLPNGGRGAGYFAQGFRYPVMGGVKKGSSGYSLWMHENGLDQVNLSGGPTAMRSYFETPYLSGPKSSQPNNRGVSVEQFEPDMIQAGDISCFVIGADNARQGDYADDPNTLPAIPANKQEAFAGFRSQRRLARFHVESNTLGGNYVTGKNFLHVKPSDARLFK